MNPNFNYAPPTPKSEDEEIREITKSDEDVVKELLNSKPDLSDYMSKGKDSDLTSKKPDNKKRKKIFVDF